MVKAGERVICLYRSGRAHAGDNLSALLARREAGRDPPIAMSDALAANRRDDDDSLIRCHCLAHGRRQFTDLEAVFPAESHHVITVPDHVFEHEAATRALSAAERLACHQAHGGPPLAALREWLERQFQDRAVEPNRSLGQAFAYLLKRWETLTQFLRVPGAPLDGNAVERALKLFIRQRNNSPFHASAHGAGVASLLTGLIATRGQAGVNALDYLVALQLHRHAVFQQPAAWLPWNYQENRAPALAAPAPAPAPA